jgi:hypothetical protein
MAVALISPLAIDISFGVPSFNCPRAFPAEAVQAAAAAAVLRKSRRFIADIRIDYLQAKRIPVSAAKA